MKPAGTEEQRERLEAEDFQVQPGAEFDPVNWLNARLARSGVPFDKLDQHLSSLAMRCQLLCQDTSESIEVACNQLVAQLPATGRDLDRMRDQALSGRDRLGKVLDGLKDADDRKQSGLHGLAEIDAVKTRVETACSALREVGSWDRKVRDCEQLIHSGKLPAALAQVASLKGVLDAFRMLPEYGKKEAQLQQLEENLLATARRRAKVAVERNVVADLVACSEVFLAMKRREEPVALAEGAFAEVAEKAWAGQDPRSDTSATALAAATRAVFDAVAQCFRERWPLLQALDEQAAATSGEETGEAKAGAPKALAGGPSAIATAVRAALGVLSGKLETSLAAPPAAGQDPGAVSEEALAHMRAARAVALLAEYVEGFSALALCAPVVETPSLWDQACKDGAGGAQALPYSLLREVATFVIWCPMQDDAAALAPPVGGQIRPSEAVLAAESNAKRLMQMPPTWARYLEEKNGGKLAVVWLACVDATCEGYWKLWDKLVDTFKNTLASRAGSTTDCAHDPALLNECMQLHRVLHDTLRTQFADCQGQALQLAARMDAGAQGTALGRAVAEKMRDGGAWCGRLGVPSADSLRGAAALLEAVHPDTAATSPHALRALPLAGAALARAERQVVDLVTQCCVQPVVNVLSGYAEAREWTRPEDSPDFPPVAGGLSPLPCITAVGEHLFALTPQLERPQADGTGQQVQWLPAVLDGVVEAATQRVVQIRQLTPAGAQQLITDLEYLHKVTEALGSGAAATAAETAAAQLGETLRALTHLAAQQRQQLLCAAKGEPFLEGPREGPPLPRRSERALRAALGLGPGA